MSESYPTDCRILCLSANLDHAITLIQSVQALTKTASNESSFPELDSPSKSGYKIPWTIVNKYYSANVHFLVQDVEDWAAGETSADDVPAVIFVWASGESWKVHAQHVAKVLERGGCEPKVALAVRIRTKTNPNHDEEEGVDEFLSQLGFEFVDCRDASDLRSNDRSDDDEFDDIPDLPRVVDALSTIMWPCMKSNQTTYRTSRNQVDLEDWANQSFDTEIGVDDVNGRKLRVELAELESWLESEPPMHPVEEDAWRTTSRSAKGDVDPAITFSTSPTDLGKLQQWGFDDDFTVFVSAAPEDPDDDLFDAKRLRRMHAGASYASLGSLSNFDGESDDVVADEEEGLPTREEIQATSDRIFGGAVREPSSSAMKSTSTTNAADESSLQDDLAAFDLTRVYSALEGMKAEISGMEDDAERRKAAARVALGLVYGLERD